MSGDSRAKPANNRVTRFTRVSPRLTVHDLAPTVAFYTETLGFEAGDPWPEHAPMFVILTRDDVEVQFYVPEDGERERVGHGTLSFDVDDAQALHRSLGERVTVEWGPEVYWYGRREFGIRDPNGYLIIFSEVTDDPPTCEDS